MSSAAGSLSRSRRAAFLDRDGVLNQDRGDYVKSIDEMQLLPGVGEALQKLGEAGYLRIVVTNQSPIGHGIFTHEHLAAMHAWLTARLAEQGGELDEILYCPHRPDEGCSCRKPAPGLILDAIERHGIDRRESFMVGDRGRDIAAGHAAGVRTIYITSTGTADDDPSLCADHRAPDLPAAVDWILKNRLLA